MGCVVASHDYPDGNGSLVGLFHDPPIGYEPSPLQRLSGTLRSWSQRRQPDAVATRGPRKQFSIVAEIPPDLDPFQLHLVVRAEDCDLGPLRADAPAAPLCPPRENCIILHEVIPEQIVS